MKSHPRVPEACYLIHSRPYREHSLLLTLLSLEHGRVSAVCRSSAKTVNHTRAVLQPFTPLECEFIAGHSELLTLCSARPVGMIRKIPLPAVFSAQYVNELIYWLYRDTEGSPEFFALYIKTIDGIGRGDEFMALRSFESGILQVLGYAPDFGEQRFDPDELYVYVPGSGFFEAQSGDFLKLSGRALNEVAAGKLNSPEARSALKIVNHTAIAALLNGRKLHSRELYASFLKETENGQFLRPKKEGL
ncbi:MAG: DNA repair protein RecO [Succinatimonas hippei]|nr:DNA repair protein RecO [Succinatimonas hippei]